MSLVNSLVTDPENAHKSLEEASDAIMMSQLNVVTELQYNKNIFKTAIKSAFRGHENPDYLVTI